MELIILGSGGAIPIPRPFCECIICKKARKNIKYRRATSSLFVKDINTLIDCGEDIYYSINRENIKKIDNLFITHWHPDHTFGLRTILEANYNFRNKTAKRIINVYIPKNVYKSLKKYFPVIDYYFDVEKVAKLFLIEDKDKLKFGKYTIEVIGYQGNNSDTYAYLIKESKTVLYSPCDTISFDKYKYQKNLDLWITECGISQKKYPELFIEDLIKRVKEIKPKKTLFTHIEEIEQALENGKYLENFKKKYSNVKFEYTYDGMKIKL